jgi:dsRNA-specific ribonuclease
MLCYIMTVVLFLKASELLGKTPISYLQELCSKKGITPQYDLIANEGAVHEPLFVFRVSAGDHIGNGKGSALHFSRLVYFM